MGKEEQEAFSPSVERESKSNIVDGVVVDFLFVRKRTTRFSSFHAQEIERAICS